MELAESLTLEITRLSLCKCGFPLFNSNVKLGRVYEVYPATQGIGTLICGGCKAHITITTIYCAKTETGQSGLLPLEAFL